MASICICIWVAHIKAYKQHCQSMAFIDWSSAARPQCRKVLVAHLLSDDILNGHTDILYGHIKRAVLWKYFMLKIYTTKKNLRWILILQNTCKRPISCKYFMLKIYTTEQSQVISNTAKKKKKNVWVLLDESFSLSYLYHTLNLFHVYILKLIHVAQPDALAHTLNGYCCAIQKLY